LTAIEIDAALKGLDEAYENLKSARAMLLVALEKEPLDP
jgi:hypothetical protein